MDKLDSRPLIHGHEWCRCGELVPTPTFQSCGGRCFGCFMSLKEVGDLNRVVVAVQGAKVAVPVQTQRRQRSTPAARRKKSQKLIERERLRGHDRRRADHKALLALAALHPEEHLVLRNIERGKVGLPPLVAANQARFDEAVATALAASPYHALLEGSDCAAVPPEVG